MRIMKTKYAACSKAVILLLFFIVAPIVCVGVLCWSMFCDLAVGFLSSLLRKRELIVFL